MTLLIINYHYLKFQGKKLLKTRGVSRSHFIKQLKELKARFQPISFKQYQEIVQANPQDKNKYLILTFDDGLKQDSQKAAKEAQKLNIPLTFFVPGQPLLEKKVLVVQKIHLLLEQISLEKLAELFYRRLNQIEITVKRRTPSGLNLKQIYRYDQQSVRKFKLDLNYFLPYEISQQLIDQVFKIYFPKEKNLAEQLYLSSQELKKLASQGFEIGGHSFSHQMLSRLNFKEQKNEIEQCRKALNPISRQPLPFSTPFGHQGASNQTTVKLLKKYQFFCLATMERKINENNPDLHNLTRFDVNDVFEKAEFKNSFKKILLQRVLQKS